MKVTVLAYISHRMEQTLLNNKDVKKSKFLFALKVMRKLGGRQGQGSRHRETLSLEVVVGVYSNGRGPGKRGGGADLGVVGRHQVAGI